MGMFFQFDFQKGLIQEITYQGVQISAKSADVFSLRLLDKDGQTVDYPSSAAKSVTVTKGTPLQVEYADFPEPIRVKMFLTEEKTGVSVRFAVENGYPITDVNYNNLDTISKKQLELSERRITEIFELVRDSIETSRALIRDGMDIYGALSVVADGIAFDSITGNDDSLPQNEKRLSTVGNLILATDRILFCDMYAENLTFENTHLTEKHFLPSSEIEENVVYIRNPYADEAYDVFSQELIDPRVKYVGSFKEAVRSLLDGDAGYCLLPLEERGGVRLPTVSEIIYRNDLKINSVTPVFGMDGNADMKYALVSRSFTVPSLSPDDDCYLEIRIDSGKDARLGELLCATEHFGIGLYRLNTLTFDTEEGIRSYYSIVFRKDGGSFIPLLVYLTLFTSDFVPIGIYKNLE